MNPEMQALTLAAIAIAVVHTLTGPDHYLPFIALSRTRGWSLPRTLAWTVACGCGHVWSSVLIGLGGATLGWSMAKIEWLQQVRGGVAGWGLLGFGLVYAIWGWTRAQQDRKHKHFEMQEDGLYVYEHLHGQPVVSRDKHPVTPWVMFIIFLLGPCEPMIPLLYYPGAQDNWQGICFLIGIYTVFTLTAMLAMVLLGYYGITLISAEKSERYMHAIAGATIFICGAGMLFMGW